MKKYYKRKSNKKITYEEERELVRELEREIELEADRQLELEAELESETEIDYQELKDINEEIKQLEKTATYDDEDYLELLMCYREELYYLEEENFDISYIAYENMIKDNEEYIKSSV